MSLDLSPLPGDLEKTPGEEEAGLWSGEPITLHHSWDRFRFQWVSDNPRFPARHVHPDVHAGALAVVKATAERDALIKEHAAFLQERLQLVQRLRRKEDRRQAVAELQSFDGNVELTKANLPDSEDDVLTAWQALDGAVGASWTEWLSYLRQKGSEAAQRLSETIFGSPTWSLRQALDEIELIDALMRLEGIKPDRTPTVNTEIKAQFDRGQRTASLRKLWDGVDLGTEGQQYGIGALPSIYRDLFATPEPVPVVESDPTPPAVRARKTNPGPGAGSREVNPVTGIVGEIPWTP